MAATASTVDVRELVFLFRGECDRLGHIQTTGYPTIGLAERICAEAQPKSVLVLFGIIYPGWRIDQVPAEEAYIVRAGYGSWLVKAARP